MKQMLAITLLLIGIVLFSGHFLQAAPSGFELIKDIRPGSSGSDIQDLTSGSQRLFFKATADTHDKQIWTSDGTTTGTLRMTDFDDSEYYVRNSSSHLTVDNIYFFDIRHYSDNGYDLWRSNGTISGTYKLIDLPGYLNDAAGAGGLYYFVPWNDQQYGSELWVSDNTVPGTRMVKEIYPGRSSGSPKLLTPVNNTLFFTAVSEDHGRELWKSDGTSAGTVMVQEFTDGSYSTDFRWMKNVNGTLFFVILGSDWQLWKHDPVSGQTVMVKTFVGIHLDADQSAAVGDILYFFGKGSGFDTWDLWKSDGSPGGTVMVHQFDETNTTYFGEFTNVNGMLYFKGREADSVYGRELWKSDGTSTGTVMVKDITEGSYGSTLEKFIAVDDRLFFVYERGTYVHELWMSDGTEAGTKYVDMNASSIRNYVILNGELYFYGVDGTISSYDNDIGTELYRYSSSGSDIESTALETSLDSNITDGTVPLNTSFTCTVDSGNPPYTFSWNFGDGSTESTVQNPSHTYEYAGEYAATCTVTDDNGQTITETVNIQVFNLPEEIQSWLVLTDNSDPLILSLGDHAQVFGSTGINIINIETGARVQCLNFIGSNQINVEESSSEFTVYRSGATVYLNSSTGTRIKIPATQTSQTLRFADGSSGLVITNGKVMLGNQVVSLTESVKSVIDSPVDEADTSTDIF